MVAKMAAKMGCFFKNDQYLCGICFVLSVYSKPFNFDSARGHVAVKNIINAGLFWEIQDGCQDGRHKVFY